MAYQNLTVWYLGGRQPVREGIYMRRWGSQSYYSFWDGKNWGFLERDIASANRHGKVSSHQMLPWRGLSVDPNAGYITVMIPRPDSGHIQRRDHNGEHSVSVFYKTEKKSSEAFELIRKAMK